MLQRALVNKRALIELNIDDPNFPALTSRQWLTTSKVVAMLKPFKDVTVNFSAWSSTIAEIIPSIKTLTLFLDKASNERFFYGIQTTVNALKDSMKRRLESWLLKKKLVVATFLDPRFKMQFQTADLNSDQLQQIIIDSVEECAGNESRQHTVQEPDVGDPTTSNEGISFNYTVSCNNKYSLRI